MRCTEAVVLRLTVSRAERQQPCISDIYAGTILWRAQVVKVDEHPDQTLSVPVIRVPQGLNLVQRPEATPLVENGGNEWGTLTEYRLVFHANQG